MKNEKKNVADLFLVHFHETSIDFRPCRYGTDAPQLIRMFSEISNFHLLYVINATDEHIMVLVIVNYFHFEKLIWPYRTIHCKF